MPASNGAIMTFNRSPMRQTRLLTTCLLSTCVLLVACASMNPPVKREAADVKSLKPAAANPRQQLNLGIESYNNGDYQTAIKRLNSAYEAAQGDTATQLLALKYLAFNYCVIGQKTLCQQRFEHALRIDPNFDLAVGEKGHPLWGPVFTRAKKSR
jgi:Tfp pilus assembly protein PilF